MNSTTLNSEHSERRLRPSLFSGLAAFTLSLLVACSPGGGGSAPPPAAQGFDALTNLSPGKQGSIEARLRVNIVFIGYRQTPPGQVATARQVNLQDFRETLPKTYSAINRTPSAYGRVEPTGNTFTYDYNYVFADRAFEDEFFGFLKNKTTGKEKDLTRVQRLFNCQGDPTCKAPAENITRPVEGNLEIDGAVVENWLADNGARVGAAPGEHTVYLINWYDRPDFKFHSYTRADAKETDTGEPFGESAAVRMTAWGGSVRPDKPAQRVWFYDLSANPDAWTATYNVSSLDVDGDGIPDYRMPPIWEYGTRRANIGYGRKVSPDLALMTRYTALNLLFTPSPIYRVALTPPHLPESIELNVTLEQGAGAAPRAKVLKPELLQSRVSVLQPFSTFSSKLTEAPLSGNVATLYRCFFVDPSKAPDDICAPNYADFLGEPIFQYGVTQLRQKVASQPASKYLLPIYLFNDGANTQPGLLGVAYDDGQTGTQSFVYSFLTPELNAAGFGLTDTTVHEAGHHLSLSHPHDGYDSEEDISYGPSGPFYFAWAGDESASVMSYNSLTSTFGQFNLDSQYRYLTAAYLNTTNAILQIVRSAGKEAEVLDAAVQADAAFTQAKARYSALAYLDAARLAHQGYRQVLNAAQGAKVSVQGYRWYENLSGLAAGRGQPRYSPTFQKQTGAVIFPELTRHQLDKRLSISQGVSAPLSFPRTAPAR